MIKRLLIIAILCLTASSAIALDDTPFDRTAAKEGIMGVESDRSFFNRTDISSGSITRGFNNTDTMQLLVDMYDEDGAPLSVSDEIDFDAVVDAGGGADYTTLQAAEDALDGGNYSVWVKGGTYTAGLTADSNGNAWYFEPGTDVDAAMTFSGDNIYVNFMNNCNLDALLTLSGDNICVEVENGLTGDGLVMSGAAGYFDGGGWGSLMDGGATIAPLTVPGSDCIIKNGAFQNTSAGGSADSAIDITGDRNQFIYLKIVDADDRGIHSVAGADDCLFLGCYIVDADSNAMFIDGFRSRIIGNYIAGAGGTEAIRMRPSADNSVCAANIIMAGATTSIDLNAGTENCVVVANRGDGNINDLSATSVVQHNNLGTASAAISGTAEPSAT